MTADEEFKAVVAIGASAGGLQAVTELLEALPEGFEAPIVIAMHSSPTSQLARVLGIRTKHKMIPVTEGMTLRAGHIYVLPPAKHGFFAGTRMTVSSEVNDSGFRPSIDALFMSLASTYRERAIAVVLSGTMKDGMRGAQVVYDMGGRTIVQDPEDAMYDSMPQSVILADHPQVVLSAEKLGEWLRDELDKLG